MNINYIKPEHVIVSIPLNDFLNCVKFSSTLTCFSSEISVCYFYCSMDDDDKKDNAPFDGIKIISNYDEEVILSFEDWLYYLEQGAKEYLSQNPKDKKVVDEYLTAYKKITNLQ